MTMDLFSKEKTVLKLPNAEIEYIPNFLETKKSTVLFETLLKETPWQHDSITVFGRTYPQPRLTALYGENDEPYSYSNITMHPKPLPSYLLELKKKLELYSGHIFTTVLLNLYRDGSDSNGWHADNEKELGKNPVIASISLGAERLFKFKHRRLKEENFKFR